MKNTLEAIFTKIFASLGVAEPKIVVSRAGSSALGEYATNAAMVNAKAIGKSPMEVGLQVREQLMVNSKRLTARQGDQIQSKSDQKISLTDEGIRVLQDIESVEVVPPGFINIKITEAGLSTSVSRVLDEKEGFEIVKNVNGEQSTVNSMQNEQYITNSKPLTVNREPLTYLVEFAHPNTHKAFHIGHLRNITTGESLVRLFESQGIRVIRANYQGDVGMHIAKCIYGILRIQNSKFKIQNWKEAKSLSIHERVEYLGERYAAGSKAFEEDEKAKEVIKDYNYLVYAAAARLAKEKNLPEASTDYLSFVTKPEEKEEVYELWKETRQWSLDYFDKVYKRVGTHYDRLYFESECLPGVDLAKEAVKKGVLKESDGAIIFDGKPYGIDTRVFVNSLGLPTYEGKELALASTQAKEHKDLDKLIHVLGGEQVSFTKVTFKVEELLGILSPGIQHHLVYGWVKLKHGKMSSRTGQVVLGEWLLEEARKMIKDILDQSKEKYSKEGQEEIMEKAAVAAVKYAFLKVGTNQEIAFDFAESVSFHGDSGPYLQYTYARCRSVLRKAGVNYELRITNSDKKGKNSNFELRNSKFNLEEREIARLIHFFPEVVADAAANYAPNTLCTYLYDLAQAFNLFYQKHDILKSKVKMQKSKVQVKSQEFDDITNKRLLLTQAAAQTLKNGLYLLGIETLDRM